MAQGCKDFWSETIGPGSVHALEPPASTNPSGLADQTRAYSYAITSLRGVAHIRLGPRNRAGRARVPRAAVGVVGRADRVEWAGLVRDRSLRRAATIQCWGLAQAQRPHPREKRVFDHSVSPQCGALAATRPGAPRGVGHAVRPIVETASCCLTRGAAHVARPSRDLQSVMGWRPQTSAHQLRVKHYHS